MAGQARFRVHLKILRKPFISVTNMVRFMEDVYAAHGFKAEVMSREEMDLPDLKILDVGSCSESGALTGEQVQLFQNREGVGTKDIVAYFVEQTIPPLNGCARHPSGSPGVVVARMSSRWTLAHEIGHVLGLDHVGDPNDHHSLMTGSGTLNIGSTPPALSPGEIVIIRQSEFVSLEV